MHFSHQIKIPAVSEVISFFSGTPCTSHPFILYPIYPMKHSHFSEIGFMILCQMQLTTNKSEGQVTAHQSKENQFPYQRVQFFQEMNRLTVLNS